MTTLIDKTPDLQILVDGKPLTEDEKTAYNIKYRQAIRQVTFSPERDAVAAVRQLRTFGQKGFDFRVGDNVAVERDGIIISGKITETITTKGGRQAGIVKFENGAYADLGTAEMHLELAQQLAEAVTPSEAAGRDYPRILLTSPKSSG